jgi:hypothetical protein
LGWKYDTLWGGCNAVWWQYNALWNGTRRLVNAVKGRNRFHMYLACMGRRFGFSRSIKKRSRTREVLWQTSHSIVGIFDASLIGESIQKSLLSYSPCLGSCRIQLERRWTYVQCLMPKRLNPTFWLISRHATVHGENNRLGDGRGPPGGISSEHAATMRSLQHRLAPPWCMSAMCTTVKSRDYIDGTYSQNPPIQRVALLLRMKHRPVLLPFHRCMEDSLVHIRIKRLLLNTRIEPRHAMSLQRAEHCGLRHLQALVHIDQVRMKRLRRIFRRVGRGGRGRCGELTSWDAPECVLEIVDGGDEVACEFLEGEVAGGLGFALGAVLKISVVCDGAQIFILCSFMSVYLLAFSALTDSARGPSC